VAGSCEHGNEHSDCIEGGESNVVLASEGGLLAHCDVACIELQESVEERICIV
jgi:hypothetical protein